MLCDQKRVGGWVLWGVVVGAALAVGGCGGHRQMRSGGSQGKSSAPVAPRSPIPSEACAAPVADPALVRDRNLAGALSLGPIVLYPADDITTIPAGARDGVVSAKVVVIVTGAKPVTLAVGRAARARFSLLFAGATTGRAATGFRVADGIAAVRFPACGGPVGFRGGVLYRRSQCVPITVRADGEPVLRATLAIGRPPASCPGALRPRSG